MVNIFIPSYHRPTRIKTAKYFINLGYDPELIHIVVDSEADDIEDYVKSTTKMGVNLHIFDMNEARERYDYVHRPSPVRRSAGQARNMFYDIAKSLGIDFYLVIDDDTNSYQTRPFGVYTHLTTLEEMTDVLAGIKDFMERRRIGLFGLSQTGDMFERFTEKILRNKVMNTTFVNTKYIYRGEKAVQDNDTSQFVGVMNAGLFTGSLASGVVLHQTASATASGGLTDLYHELKLLNKALVIPIQYPSLSYAEKQEKNGGRLHHRIKYRYLYPKLMRGKRSNIAWDTYPEDTPFTNEPLNRKVKDE